MNKFDAVPTESKYEDDIAKDKNSQLSEEKKITKRAKLNQKGFTELVLLIEYKSSCRKIAFHLVKNYKSSDYPKGNCKLVWDRFVAKYIPKSLTSLLKYKKEFENSKLKSANTHPEDWISKLEGLAVDIKSVDTSLTISDQEFIVKILNNLPS